MDDLEAISDNNNSEYKLPIGKRTRNKNKPKVNTLQIDAIVTMADRYGISMEQLLQ